MLNNKFYIYLSLICLVLVCASVWPLLKIELAYISPLWLTFLRLLSGSLLAFFILWVIKQSISFQPKDIPAILVVGVLQMGIYLALSVIGVDYTKASISSLLAYSTPIWVYPASIFFSKKNSMWLYWLVSF